MEREGEREKKSGRDREREIFVTIPCLIFSWIQLPDKHGITALLAAVYEDHEECVRVLVSSVSLVDCNVRTSIILSSLLPY